MGAFKGAGICIKARRRQERILLILHTRKRRACGVRGGGVRGVKCGVVRVSNCGSVRGAGDVRGGRGVRGEGCTLRVCIISKKK